MRPAYAIFTGLVTAILIVFMAQMIREGMYPQPPIPDDADSDFIKIWMSKLPTKAFVIIAISHGFASFAAGLISSLTAGSSRMIFGMIAILIVFIAVMIYLFSYFFPGWFVITDTVVTAVAGFSGVLIGSARYFS